ncbi:riboflavin synthase [Aegicerativicinus sediminis]
MFTGIVEDVGVVSAILKEKGNLNLTIKSKLSPELKIDQSLAHDGICLTVTSCNNEFYTVTAIEETILKTSIGEWKTGKKVNLERAMILGSRLDGHIVQGHVDQTGLCTSIKERDGSWYFTFSYDVGLNNYTIEKGSITINGVSLTVVDSEKGKLSVAIIPYTFQHTNFSEISIGDKVNLEFDVIGKYVRRLNELGL